MKKMFLTLFFLSFFLLINSTKAELSYGDFNSPLHQAVVVAYNPGWCAGTGTPDCYENATECDTSCSVRSNPPSYTDTIISGEHIRLPLFGSTKPALNKWYLGAYWAPNRTYPSYQLSCGIIAINQTASAGTCWGYEGPDYFFDSEFHLIQHYIRTNNRITFFYGATCGIYNPYVSYRSCIWGISCGDGNSWNTLYFDSSYGNLTYNKSGYVNIDLSSCPTDNFIAFWIHGRDAHLDIDNLTTSTISTCRTCDPVSISRSGSAYYLLSGWCLFSNLVMCNPILLSILFLIGMVLFIIIRLKMGK